jgi:hypothetical protein
MTLHATWIDWKFKSNLMEWIFKLNSNAWNGIWIKLNQFNNWIQIKILKMGCKLLEKVLRIRLWI